MSAILKQMMADSPVLLWPMNEGSGTPQALVGTAPTGMYGGTSWASDTIMGKGVDDNGAGQISREGLTSPELPVGSSARTLEGWCRLTSVPGTLLSYGVTNNLNEHCALQVGTSAFSDGVNIGNNKNWSTATPTGAWQHIVMAYAGGAGGQAIFYLNGIADVTTTLSLNTTSGVDRVRAGVRSDDARATNYLTGRIGPVAVYSAALSASRVMAHYRAGIRGGVSVG